MRASSHCARGRRKIECSPRRAFTEKPECAYIYTRRLAAADGSHYSLELEITRCTRAVIVIRGRSPRGVVIMTPPLHYNNDAERLRVCRGEWEARCIFPDDEKRRGRANTMAGRLNSNSNSFIDKGRFFPDNIKSVRSRFIYIDRENGPL